MFAAASQAEPQQLTRTRAGFHKMPGGTWTSLPHTVAGVCTQKRVSEDFEEIQNVLWINPVGGGAGGLLTLNRMRLGGFLVKKSLKL